MLRLLLGEDDVWSCYVSGTIFFFSLLNAFFAILFQRHECFVLGNLLCLDRFGIFTYGYFLTHFAQLETECFNFFLNLHL